MRKIIGVSELQRRFRSVFEEAVNQQTPVVLTRGSRPEPVLISCQEYRRLQAAQAEDALAQFDLTWKRLARLNVDRRGIAILSPATAVAPLDDCRALHSLPQE